MNNRTDTKKFTIRFQSACLALAVSLLLGLLTTPAFAAAPPAITSTSFSHVTETSATLEALLDAGERTTKYHFQYVDRAAFEASGFTTATTAPLPDAELSGAITGHGDLSAARTQVKNLTTTAGSFFAGQTISGPGIPAATTIRAATATTLELSQAPTATTPGATLSAAGPQPLAVPITGLTPGTTYHFRLIAHNSKQAKEEDTTGPEEVFSTYAPPPSFAPCPQNQAFREAGPAAALPDCRAYEQASPTDKNGADARGRVAYLHASPNGERISFLGASGLIDDGGYQDLPSYLSFRTGGQWSTRALLPPESSGENAHVFGWTPDFSQVFDFATRFDQAGGSTVLSLDPAAGSLSALIPYGAGLIHTPFYAGASADGSLVLFEDRSQLSAVPAALQDKPNLYLYDRQANTISLADLLNDGSPPPEGAFAGPYAWGAGTTPDALASGGAAARYYTQDTHAVAADGSLYFTAAKTGQLYLRVNPTQPQSAVINPGEPDEECTEAAKACTLHVSATHKQNGSGPGGADSAGARPAAFLAATPDGAHAFFTSSEKLTNDANTGPEPTGSPAIARANLSDGSEKTLGFLPAHAQGLAVFGEHIYWADPEAGAIGRAKLNGEEPEPHFLTPGSTQFETHPLAEPGVIHLMPTKPTSVVLKSNYIYWTNAGPLGGDSENFKHEVTKEEHLLDGAGTIGRAKLSPSEVPEEVDSEFITGASNPQGIAADDEHLYWTNDGTSNGNGCTEITPPNCTHIEHPTRSVGRSGIESASPEQLFIPLIGLHPLGITVDSKHLYVAETSADNYEQGYIGQFDLSGKLLTTHYLGLQARVVGVTVDAAHVYWGERDADAIGRANLELQAAEPEFIKEAGRPEGVAVDAEHIYWSADQQLITNPGNDLYRFDATDGELTDLAPDPGDPNGAEVLGLLGTSEDGSYVYFAANGDLDGAGPAQAGDCKSKVGGAFLTASGQCSLYLAHAGTITYIARLEANADDTRNADALDWLPTPLSPQLEKTSRVSADGQTLLFSSQQRLSAYDNHGVSELYRYRVGEGVACVSCNPTGEPPFGEGPDFGSLSLGALQPAESNFTLSRNLSADGERVFFETPEALVAEDTNGEGGCPIIGGQSDFGKHRVCLDAYEWEAQGTGSCEEDVQGGGCLYLLSSGKSSDASYLADASASGDDVFLITRSQLVGQDQDQLQDVYDVHIGGGLASQFPLSTPPCEAEGCRPAPRVPPGFQSPGSASFSEPPVKHHHPKKHKHRKHRKHRAHHNHGANR